MHPNDGSFLSRMLALKQGSAASSSEPSALPFPPSTDPPSIQSSAPLPTSKCPLKKVTLRSNRVFLEDQYDGFRWSDVPLRTSSSSSSRNFKNSVTSSPVEHQPPSSFLPWSSTSFAPPSLHVQATVIPPSLDAIPHYPSAVSKSFDLDSPNPFKRNGVHDKYWSQRRRYFARYHEGIMVGSIPDTSASLLEGDEEQSLDEDGGVEPPSYSQEWYSLTPEVISKHVAARLTSRSSTAAAPVLILDPFSGCGGDTIHLALALSSSLSPSSSSSSSSSSSLSSHPSASSSTSSSTVHPLASLVLSCDVDIKRLHCASRNCRVYDVPASAVAFYHGDSLQAMEVIKGILGTPPEEQNCAKEFAFTTEGYALLSDVPSLLSFLRRRCPSSTFPGFDAVYLSPPWNTSGVYFAALSSSSSAVATSSSFSTSSSHSKKSKRKRISNNPVAASPSTYLVDACVRVRRDGLESNPHPEEDPTVGGGELLALAGGCLKSEGGRVAYFLPKNVDLQDLSMNVLGRVLSRGGGNVDGDVKVEAQWEELYINGKLKAGLLLINCPEEK